MSTSNHLGYHEIKVYSFKVQPRHRIGNIYSHCPNKVNEKERRKWVKEQIIAKIGKGVVFCLQQVCSLMKNELKEALESKDYEMIYPENGQKTKTFEAIAFNKNEYKECVFEAQLPETSKRDVQRSDTSKKDPKRPHTSKSDIQRSDTSKREHNFIFTMMEVLAVTERRRYFCVGSFHMPSDDKYKTAVNQLIHAGNVVRRFQNYCGTLEGVLAGDFSAEHKVAYGAVTTAKVKAASGDQDCYVGTRTKAMTSAVVSSDDAKDYIFCTENIKVLGSDEIPRRQQNGSQAGASSCPTRQFPSNHDIIGAKLRVRLGKKCSLGTGSQPKSNDGKKSGRVADPTQTSNRGG